LNPHLALSIRKDATISAVNSNIVADSVQTQQTPPIHLLSVKAFENHGLLYYLGLFNAPLLHAKESKSLGVALHCG
jgi:hypothetical protein